MTTLRVTCVIVFLCICLTSSINAQQNKFDIGVEGGLGVSKFYGSNDIPFGPQIAGLEDLSFQYNLPKILSLIVCLDFEQKGWNSYNTSPNQLPPGSGSLTTKNHYNYLTIPILVRASFGKKVLFFLNVGPYISLELKSSSYQDWEYPGMSGVFTEDATSYYKRFDLGVSLGAGIKVPIKNLFAITFEARNNVGLINISDMYAYHDIFAFADDSNIKSYNTVFLLGFEYKFGKRNKK